MSEPRLMFGYNRGFPAAAEVAWGARLILNRNGRVEFLGDRQGAAGPEEKRRSFLEYLNQHLSIKKMLQLVDDQGFGSMEDREETLYEDDRIKVLASPQASGGYVYVVAYQKPEVAA